MRAQWIASAQAVARIARRLARELAAPAAAYVPLRVEDRIVGWVTPERAHRLARWPELFECTADAVACAPRLRSAQARRHTREEIPFHTGRRRPLVEVVADLP